MNLSVRVCGERNEMKKKKKLIYRRARPREGEVQIHLRRLGSHFHRIGWLRASTRHRGVYSPRISAKQREKNKTHQNVYRRTRRNHH